MGNYSIIQKDDLKNKIEHMFGSWIQFEFNNLKQTFGLKIVPGLAIAVSQLVNHSKSEAELSIEPDYIIRENIKTWCTENQIEFYFPDNNYCHFRTSAGRDKILSIINSKIQDSYKLFCQPRMLVLNIDIARKFYESFSPDGKFKIMGMDVIEAVNVGKEFVELIY
jgi:hypothetical protein